MSVLTSLLARDRVVSVSKIEEALERQVLEGGDLETILLEMGVVPEDTLSAYRAALFGLLPATRDEVMRASRDAIRLVPRDLARSGGLVPLVLENRTLVIAAAEPPGPTVRNQLMRGLSCELSIRIVTQPRLAAALSHYYGFELEGRTGRLVDVLRKRDAGAVPYVRPPGPSLRPLRSSRPAEENAFDQGPDTQEYPAIPELEPPPSEELILPGGEESGDLEDTDERAVLPVIPRAPRSPIDPSAALGRLSPVPPATVSADIVRATRGPLSVERARELLMQATQRDDVLYVLLRFAQQFFDFVGVFSVGREGARGRLSSGSRISHELIEHVVLPLEGQGLAARAVRDKRAYIGDPGTVEEERAAFALLDRPSGRPGLALPVVLGSRAVLLVYADRNGEGLALDDAEPIATLLASVADALRRVIVQQKTLRHRSIAPHESGVIDTSAHDSVSVSPPPVSLSPPAPQPAAEPSQLEAEPDFAVAAPELDLPDNFESETDEPGSYEQENAPAFVASAEQGEAQGELSPTTPFDEDQLEAVDLDRVSYGIPFERRQARREAGVLATVDAQVRDAARIRLMGIPRTAPPPPMRDSLTPGGRTAGGYSFIAPSGAVAEETLGALGKSGPGPLGLRDSLSAQAGPSQVNGAAIAQIKPKTVERTLAEHAALTSVDTISVDNQNVNPPQRSSFTQLSNASNTSVIIDMGDQVGVRVEALLGATQAESGPVIDELMRVGEAVLPMLMQFFPGPLWFDRHKPHKRRPRGRDISAVARALVAFGERSAPYLASKLSSDDKDTCFYALMVAAEVPHFDLLDVVARRALDPDDDLRMVALDALRSFASVLQVEAVLNAFTQLSERPGKDPRRQRLALEALAELRDPRALNALLPRLGDGSEAVVQAAHRGLVLLTAQDFGLAQRKWEAWVEQCGRQHRVEWLTESLMHNDENMRTLAGDEIKQLTQQYFGYHPQLPKRDRELAQRKYREWWEVEGRAAFRVQVDTDQIR